MQITYSCEGKLFCKAKNISATKKADSNEPAFENHSDNISPDMRGARRFGCDA